MTNNDTIMNIVNNTEFYIKLSHLPPILSPEFPEYYMKTQTKNFNNNTNNKR